MYWISLAKILRVYSLIQNRAFNHLDKQQFCKHIYWIDNLNWDLQMFFGHLKNESPLNHVKGQDFILRKLIKCISWRPSLMPSRNNHQMNLLFNFDLALITTLCIQIQCKSMAVVTAILNRAKWRRAASQPTGNKCHACPLVLWYAYLSRHRQMYINHWTVWDSSLGAN